MAQTLNKVAHDCCVAIVTINHVTTRIEKGILSYVMLNNVVWKIG